MTQIIDAVYEKGVFRPLELVTLADGQKVKLSVEAAEGAPSPAEILGLAAKVYEGLSEDEIGEIEAIALDRSSFFSERSEE